MTADLAALIADRFLPDPPKVIGVAVSGGSDSLGLLHLLCDFGRAHGIAVHVATVDHGLRPEAAAEAAMVGGICTRLGVAHQVLRWSAWDGSGNLQDEARKARYRLLAQWGRDVGVDVIALGHTADDLAETFLMRLGRRAGVDGLAAMPARFDRDGMAWVRPLLQATRGDLQGYLRARGIAWADDPSNQDERFERVRMRKALAILSGVGVDTAAIADVAHNLSAAKDALDHYMRSLARDIITLKLGAVGINETAFTAQTQEMRRRLLVHALKWVSGAYYAPRNSAITEVFAALAAGPSATLAGCELRRKGENIWIFRELSAVHQIETPVGQCWDGRWRMTSASQGTALPQGLTVRALGPEGLKHCGGWRSLGLPRGAILSSPAIWNNDQLIAAPLAGWAQNWQADLERGEDTFFAAHITH